jgi:hypothetical protein
LLVVRELLCGSRRAWFDRYLFAGIGTARRIRTAAVARMST